MGEGDPIENFKKINKELELYNPLLMKRQQVVVGTKNDIAGDGTRLNRLSQYCNKEGVHFFTVSAVSGKGVRRLLSYLSVQLRDEH